MDNNFNSKLPTAERIQQAARTLVAQLSAVVVSPIPFNTLRPQFVQLSAHDDAMLEPATAEDHVRRLAVAVKLCYTRQNAPVMLWQYGRWYSCSYTFYTSKFQFSTTSTNRSYVRHY
jgi:hypothetical protein